MLTPIGCLQGACNWLIPFSILNSISVVLFLFIGSMLFNFLEMSFTEQFSVLLNVRYPVLITILYWCFFSHPWGSELDTSLWLRLYQIDQMRDWPKSGPFPLSFSTCSNPWHRQSGTSVICSGCRYTPTDLISGNKFTSSPYVCRPLLPKSKCWCLCFGA